MYNKLSKMQWFFIASIFMLLSCTHKNGIKGKARDEVKSFVEFNLKDVPFSYAGSGLAVLNHKRFEGLVLMDIRNSAFGSNSAILEFFHTVNGDTLTPSAIANPSHATLMHESSVLGEMSYETDKVFRIKGNSENLIFGLDHNLLANGTLTVESTKNGSYHIQKVDNTYGTSRFILSAIHGKLTFDKKASQFTPKQGSGNYFDIRITETDSNWKNYDVTKSFQECIDASAEEFQNWLLKMPTLPEKYSNSRQLASYALWSNIINKGGNYKRDGNILMSKNILHYVWSWDNCFTAMACSYNLPELALNQLKVIFDYQKENGELPDVVCNSHLIWAHVKPPIHGWTLRKMMKNSDLSDAQLQEMYTSLEKWTNYWLDHRDSNNNGLPEYHNGNDCMDNGTEFDVNGVIDTYGHFESANLYAYLVLQLDLLHDLAKKFNKPEEAKKWQEKSDKLLDLMIEKTWNGERFITTEIDKNTVNEKSQSLLAYHPIILGKKLPIEIRTQLINDLKTEGYLTEWGLASENLKSPFFNEDGYWRGPIWAPSTMIVVDGLNACGEHEFAKEIAQRYIDLCVKSGFRENFNPITGEGLRDASFSWTASVFLILGNEYLMD
ncbi:hypothetical protein D1614_02565 [Maribellus luteus]|uniref:Mannosylglycerate hydrolase MGH1-like glycoside hydrolase domain-containing protein n=1 Tax=Maribellus luteus TaxID=2305463 RepID=A0A399T726_9BACT|nr:trehalase family glycosidase [Maribellus luteus]RIJ50824.1 hypothetical protein D1614_02565 [Maribellus luteus]